MTGRRLILVVGALLGAFFLYLAVRSLDWAAFAATLGRSNLAWIALALVAVLAFFLVKAARWIYLVRPLARAGMAELLPPILAGTAGNFVFPHAGELARVILAGQRLNTRVSALIATVAVERIFDFLVLLLIAFAVLIPVGRMSPDMRSACIVVGVLCAVMLVAVAILMARTAACLRLAGRLLAPLSPRLRASALEHLGAAGAGLGAIASPALLAPILVLSALQWLAIIACIAFCLLAVGVPVTLAGTTSVLLLNVIGLTLPAAPGHVGTVQLAFTIGLAPFDVPQPDAFAGSVVYSVVTVVPALVLGLPGLRRAGVELRARFAAR